MGHCKQKEALLGSTRTLRHCLLMHYSDTSV